MDQEEQPRPFEVMYKAALDLIAILIEIDPPADSPEGQLLERLAAGIEEYEKHKFPEFTGESVETPTNPT